MIPEPPLPLASRVRQIDGLQLLRAVAVTLVVWGHAGQPLVTKVHSRFLPHFNIFGIDIFFVISGFILSLVVLRERRPPGLAPMADFFKRRFIRIYPIYWVFALLVLARFARSGQLMRFNYWAAFFLLPSLHDLQNHQILAYSWTMVFEVFFYLVLGLILCRIVRGAVPILIGLLIASVVAGAFWDIRRPLWIIVCNPILLEFVFGAILALIYDRVGQWRRLGIGLTVIGVCATILLNTHNPAGVAMSPQIILIDQGVFLRVATWGVCALLLVSGVVLWSPSMEHPVSRCWVILGNASYSVYITSALTLEVCGRVYLRVFRTAFSLPSRIGYQLGLTLIALAVGYLCYRFIEKPMLDALQNRFLRKNKRKVMLMVVVVPEPAASPGAQRGVAAPGGD